MAFYSEQFGLGLPHMQILHTIGKSGAISSKAIVEDTTMNKSLVSRTLGDLEQMNIAHCMTDPAKPSRRLWRLSPRGEELVLFLRPVRLRRQTEILKELTSTERTALVSIVGRLYDASEKLRKEELKIRSNALNSSKRRAKHANGRQRMSR